MKKKGKAKQRILQASFGIGLILFVVLIELVAVHPSGIYSYTQQGYKEFKIGLSKEKVLKKINKRKTIRTIRVCDPDRVFELKSRRLFEMEVNLASSDYWLCPDRTGKNFLFLFRDEILERILLQRLRFGKKKEGSILFSQCNPEIINDVEKYLTTIEKLKVFYDTDS
ncbi:MAG: hypothetical protein K8S13_11565 [Desulfobacula sp.]|uniref:hypothetical protein n=1 Tax=Desulfobacula sp. TaxID=2593537 RepID=UPI0025BFA879|nr:hypothetical protein [Desulfobacula sp.]MCD4720478.1 hypothetical protein [Desulfobacula sp.]